MHEIFINYRTDDGDKTATTIETKLADRFGKERIFRDHSFDQGQRALRPETARRTSKQLSRHRRHRAGLGPLPSPARRE